MTPSGHSVGAEPELLGRPRWPGLFLVRDKWDCPEVTCRELCNAETCDCLPCACEICLGRAEDARTARTTSPRKRQPQLKLGID